MQKIIELLLALILIFLLLLFTIPDFGHHDKNLRKFITQDEFKLVHEQLEQYKSKHGEYPSQEVGISFLQYDIYKEDRIIYKGIPPDVSDPWGTPIRYRLTNGIPKLSSAGPDTLFDTEDDITE